MLAVFVTALLVVSQSVFCQPKASASARAAASSDGASAVASGMATSSVTTAAVDSCPSACNDEPPQAAQGQPQYTCEEQKEFGQCDEDFMLGFCECTCGRCCPCNDFPPPGKAFTCAQQKDFEKCDDDFMQGYCECTCGRCPALTGEDIAPMVEEPDVATDGAPSPAPSPAPQEQVSEPACPAGLFPIFGSTECETNRCAQNRQRCADRCGGFDLIEFDCEDESSGGSSSFSSACACA
eukprot:TRINITY_DN856_c0_g1_i1.p2 TRINITY_DN856_c0_g1~~TRINITY_DN856_c0_g1_i1.p2  ORF type:complete len:238 (-),score=41.31 TRINITY_DN856_c0_g1_i1:378-1091(-)